MSPRRRGHRTLEQEQRRHMVTNIGLALVVLVALGGVALTLATGR